MAQNISEKRNFKRIPLILPLKGKYRVKALQCFHFKGETKDVCFNGLCIKVDGTNGFNVGQKIKFKTVLYPGDFSIKGQGLIRWVRTIKNSNSHINMGVQLAKISRFGLWCEKIEHKMFKMGQLPNTWLKANFNILYSLYICPFNQPRSISIRPQSILKKISMNPQSPA